MLSGHELQVLILLEKIVKTDVGCDKPLKDLTDIVENKIRIVNEILMGKLSNIAPLSLDSKTPNNTPSTSIGSSTLSPSSLISEILQEPEPTPETRSLSPRRVTPTPIVSPNSSDSTISSPKSVTDSSSRESKESSLLIDEDNIK